MVHMEMLNPTRYPSSTLFPFLLRGLHIKAEKGKGYPYDEGVTGEPSLNPKLIGDASSKRHKP